MIRTIKTQAKALFFIFKNHLLTYPTFINVSYLWGFGSVAGVILGLQIATGIFLAMHYSPHVFYAFFSVEHIMRDVNYGWLIRYAHSNGASMFFFAVYMHVARGIYYSSYSWPKELLWISGVLIFFLMKATAFMGYVLPWGQMSFWGATVITNLFSAIPALGTSVASWLWGGFSVDNPTLNRFFSLHYLLPFLIAGLVFLHLLLLHMVGSSNPTAESRVPDGGRAFFYPYFIIKDLFGFFIFLFCITFFIFFYPNMLAHPDNYIEANPMVTPVHIVPEWYFLPFYAMLRSIPDKLGGVICMGAAVAVWFFIPFLVLKPTLASNHRVLYVSLCGFMFGSFIFLGWIGSQSIYPIYVLLGQISTTYYYLFFLVLIPLLNVFEFSDVEEQLCDGSTGSSTNQDFLLTKTPFMGHGGKCVVGGIGKRKFDGDEAK